MFNDNKYSKVLVIGAGSGRDIASSVLVTEKLLKLRIEVDLAGFLTPWALHTFDGELEKPVNDLEGMRSRKFIASREGVYLDSYFEPELAKLIREYGLELGKLYLFSLQYGTTKLGDQIEKLIKKNSYDALIVVDVGGDILARKKDYPWLLTPIVDFSCLSILAGLRSSIDSYLTVVAPGVDGEIPCRNLQEIFDELKNKEMVLSREELIKSSSHYQTFQRISNEINSRTRSYSNTFRLIERVVCSTREKISDSLEKKATVKGRSWKLSFPVELRRSLAKGMYHFDLKSIHTIREVGLSYNNIFEAFMKLKQLGAGGTEVDLSFVPGCVERGEYKDIMFLLTPPERLESRVRKGIFEYGIKLTEKGDIECSVILSKDKHAFGIPSNLEINESGGFFETISLLRKKKYKPSQKTI